MIFAEINRFIKNRLIDPIDVPLFVLLSIITAVGLITLYSASYDSPERFTDGVRNVILAYIIMMVIANISLESCMRYSLPLYGLAVLLLFAVFVSGEIRKGAQRWLNFGVFSFQPSEIMKIVMPLALAWFFDRYAATAPVRKFALAFLALLLPVAFILKQPDLGTAILVGVAGFSVLFFAGLPFRFIFTMAFLFLCAIPIIWHNLFDYQKTRILMLLDPTSDPLGRGYHIIQSTIAVGSGGLFGKGWLQGTQTHLEFLPERHTDFIFAVFSEEFGFIGNLLLILCYFMIIIRAFMIAGKAKTTFSRLLAASLGVIFFMYVFVNIGMVIGLLPVVGIPLPFISYGGTAMITLFCAAGLLMCIQRQRSLF